MWCACVPSVLRCKSTTRPELAAKVCMLAIEVLLCALACTLSPRFWFVPMLSGDRVTSPSLAARAPRPSTAPTWRPWRSKAEGPSTTNPRMRRREQGKEQASFSVDIGSCPFLTRWARGLGPSEVALARRLFPMYLFGLLVGCWSPRLYGVDFVQLLCLVFHLTVPDTVSRVQLCFMLCGCTSVSVENPFGPPAIFVYSLPGFTLLHPPIACALDYSYVVALTLTPRLLVHYFITLLPRVSSASTPLAWRPTTLSVVAPRRSRRTSRFIRACTRAPHLSFSSSLFSTTHTNAHATCCFWLYACFTFEDSIF